MINLKQLNLNQGNKRLLESANLSIHRQQKIGIVGDNGCGKSSLLALILGKLEADSGEIELPATLNISHVAQEINDIHRTAKQYVLDGHKPLRQLEQQLQQAQQENNHDQQMKIQENLEHIDAYNLPSQVCNMLHGLGFSQQQYDQPLADFSGGWRMRLNLAQALILPTDLLLLDEPTNHLDLNAILWLEKWLQKFNGTLLLISHDRDFLDNTTNHILHFKNKQIKLYTGNYSEFEQQYAQQLALQQAMHVKQQKNIAHMSKFVERFRYKASKAKQAQSRLKAIAKLPQISAVQAESEFNFEFFSLAKSPNPLVKLKNVSLNFAEHKIFDKINLTLSPGDRIGLLGPNGAGKSTLIKLLNGNLNPSSGERIAANDNLHIAYFSQHQLEQLNFVQSPTWHIQAISPKATEQQIRNFLATFNFKGDMVNQSIQHFSGGEKARLVLALLVWQKPNLLLLDEPSNHLDLTMRAALEFALQSFEGTLVVISHDRHLLRTTADQFLLIHNKQLISFDGDLDDYKEWLKQQDNNPTKTNDDKPQNNYKQQQQLKNRIKKLETEITNLQAQLYKLDLQLADEGIYQSENEQQLKALLEKRSLIAEKMAECEDEWINLE